MKSFLKISFIMILFKSCLFAQAPQWINYTNGDEIYALANDGDYLWIGTRLGLVKVNKISEETFFYDKLNSGLKGKWIYNITIDKSGNKWIVNHEGLFLFDDNNWTVYGPSNFGLPDSWIYDIAVDDSNNKWIGTDKGLVKFDCENWSISDTNNSDIPSDHINCITTDGSGLIWIGTDNGFAKLDDGVWIVYESDHSLINNVHDIAVDGSGNVWLKTDEGLVKFIGPDFWHVWPDYFQHDNGSFQIDPYGNLWFSDGQKLIKVDEAYWYTLQDIYLPITCFVIDENAIWLSAAHPKYGFLSGLLKYDQSKSWTKINTSSSPMPMQAVFNLEIDKVGNKWFSCGIPHANQANYLIRIDGNEWTCYDTTNSSLKLWDGILCLTIDESNQIWIGTYKGLTLFDGENWTNYEIRNTELPYNSLAANCITIDDQGVKWIGTSGGLMKFDGYKWEMFNKYNSDLPCNIITCITIDKANDKWIVTGSDCYEKAGLVKYNGETWEVFNTENSGLPHNFISCLAIDSMDNKWIGTVEGGLVKYDDNEWTLFNESNSQLPTNGINYIKIDKNNIKWIGTAAGLVKFDDESWTIYTEENSGLVSNWVRSIAIDNASNIWIGTAFGMSVFNENGISSNDDLSLKNTIVPIEYLLSQNYPNPFNPSTTIEYNVRAQRAVPQQINLSIYDLLGQKVATLVNKKQPAGSYQVQWDATGFATGVYYYKIETAEYSEVKKMILIK